VSVIKPKSFSIGYEDLQECAKFAPWKARGPMSMRIVADRSSLKSPAWLSLRAPSFAMFTSPIQASKISSSITPKGASPIELENFWRHARTRRTGCPPERRPALFSDIPSALTFRFYLWSRHGRQRIPASAIQEPPSSRHYCHQHGLYRHLGRGHAA